MAKVYIETLPSSLYSRTLWDPTGGTNYVIGDRVSINSANFLYSSGTVDDSHDRVYVCISDNNSTSYPFEEPTNWVIAGSSEEYPMYAVDGQISINSMNNEVYLEHQASRYKGNGSNRFTWRQATAQGTEHGELIFGDGEYSCIGAAFTIDQLSFTAKNSGKVSISTDGFGAGAILQGRPSTTQNALDAIEVSIMTGITFIVSGSRSLHGNNLAFGLHNCIFKDTVGSPYTTGQFRLGNSGCYLDVKNTSFNLPNTSIKLIGWQPMPHRDKQSKIESCTFYMSLSNQYSPIAYGSSPNINISKNIFAFSTVDFGNGWTNASDFRLGAGSESKDNVIFCYDSNVVPPTEEENCLVLDPLFIDRENGDLRLRPSSPLIGGLLDNESDERNEIESQYPQGKWFDSNAAAGGDGSWETPYNNYGEAINSFTGDEAVVLIKKGQHELRRGYWNGSTWFYNVDLPKSYPDGIKFIGMGSDTIFTTDSDVTGYGAFFVSSGNARENLEDTPFTFKNFDILLNNTSIVNRGVIDCLKAEFVNVNVSQAPNLGLINSNLFDYTMSTDSADGHYLKMSSCTINVSQSGLSNKTNFLVGGNGGLKQFKGCTFVDLNRTTSTNTAAPDSFIHPNFGYFQGSYLHDCIIYSNTPNTQHFGTNPTQGSQQGSTSLEIKNVIVYSENQTVSVGDNFGDNVSTVNPKLIATEPHDFDLRLRPDSPAIGGIESEALDVYYLQPGNPYNGDGSQKDASSMTADGDPGPFNDFNKILAAGVPYGSKIIILNGTYSWPNAFHVQKGASNWADYTYEGYSYHAETLNGVIFDANLQAKVLGHYTYGGAAGSGTFIDLHTSFNGVQFNRSVNGSAWPHNTTAIYATTDTLGKGSLTFNSCQFLGWIQGVNANWTGGSRNDLNSSIHWNGCIISTAFENDNGSLLGGQDKLAYDTLSNNWSWKNCVFYSPHGETTFFGVNAPNGTWFGPSQIFGTSFTQTSRIFKGNILYVPGGSTKIGPNSLDKWPQINNNALIGVDIDATEEGVLVENNNLIDVDPLFVDPSNDNFSLRPLSPLIGKG